MELKSIYDTFPNNPHLYHALAADKGPESGALRETFFVNMLRVGQSVSAPARGIFW